MTTVSELNERIIELQDKQIAALESARQKEKELHAAEMKRTSELYEGAVQHVAAERDEAIALADELKKDVQHWQSQFDREHAAFEQAAAERDQAIKDKADLRRRLHAAHSELAAAEEQYYKIGIESAQLYADHTKALEFIDNIAEMIACDCTLSDITDEFIAWRRGEWTPTEYADDAVYKGTPWVTTDEAIEDPYRYCVYVVEEQGGERVFTGFFADYDLARESVDLMVARGCYEAWVEDNGELH